MKSFRDLHDDIMDYQGASLFDDVLNPFIPDGLKCMEPLKKLAKLRDSPPGSLNEEDLWSLFALAVCNDYLLTPLRVSLKEYIEFFQKLGFSVIDKQKSFDPLIHEIVDVGNWPKEEEGISLGCCYWPGLRFGELIFSRSAVDVFCHEKWGILSGAADCTTLYFTNRRVRRKVDDQSHGWGSNSRWRADFSRNYVTEEYSFVNIDSQHDLHARPSEEDLDDLTLDQARELIVNRCLVGHIPEVDDYYPYNWHLTLRNTENKWPIKNEDVISTEEALMKIGAKLENS